VPPINQVCVCNGSSYPASLTAEFPFVLLLCQWKCGLCEKRNVFGEEGHTAYFCVNCARDRTVDFK